jgi:hypothetical protein
MREGNVVRLRDDRGGVGSNLPGAAIHCGRYEIVTAGRDPDFAFTGSDAYKTSVYTGLVVPALPSAAIGGARYLFMLARAQFNSGQRGVRLVGIRLYAELIARVTGQPPRVFHKQIVNPLFHPPDGSISWHVMVIDKTWRDRRNPASTDSVVFEDSFSPALLYETIGMGVYTPPNGGRPWGTPIDSSLGNIHELRYPWRTAEIEKALDIPVPVPSDIAIFASVRQNDPATNPNDAGLTPNQFEALDDEEQFLTAYSAFAQYGHIAASLVFRGDSI